MTNPESLLCYFELRQNIGGKTDSPAHDLSPSQSTVGLLSLLKDILSSTSVLDEQPQQLEEIISSVIEPLVQSLSSSAGSFSTTGEDYSYISKLNGLIQNVPLIFQMTSFISYSPLSRSRRLLVELPLPDPLHLVPIQGQRRPPRNPQLRDAASLGHVVVGTDQQSDR